MSEYWKILRRTSQSSFTTISSDIDPTELEDTLPELTTGQRKSLRFLESDQRQYSHYDFLEIPYKPTYVSSYVPCHVPPFDDSSDSPPQSAISRRSSTDFRRPSSEGVNSKVMDIIQNLREEVIDLREKTFVMEKNLGVEKVTLKEVGDKTVVVVDTTSGSVQVPVTKGSVGGLQEPGSYVPRSPSIPTLQPGGKGAPPAGMTADQLQDFKKQTLQVNALQQRVKDLEGKLSEASTAIKKTNDKADEMEEKEIQNVSDIYKSMDAINNSLSEKIAQQKVEVQKIAGDTPKPINYDPFNYGEAYAGDVVDFQARKRIIEIKLLLQGLQTSMNLMRDSLKVSPSIDLGYKVVRLDQLVGSTGFGKMVNKGEATFEDALLVNQSKTREPGKVEYPRKEIFQTSDDQESKWAITDSIMQTMYRLETELSELQSIVRSSATAENSKILEELRSNIKFLKEKQLSAKAVKNIVDEYAKTALLPSQAEKKSLLEFKSTTRYETPEPTSDTADVLRLEGSIANLEYNVKKVMGKFAALEKQMETRPKSATRKARPVPLNAACLSCDRGLEPINGVEFEKTLPDSEYFNPTAYPRNKMPNWSPPRLRYVLNRGYSLDLNNQVIGVYTIPRPVGAGYAQFWPKSYNVDASIYKELFEAPKLTERGGNLVRGYDGRVYKGDKTAVDMKHPPPKQQQAKLEARPVFNRTINKDKKQATGPSVTTTYVGREFTTTVEKAGNKDKKNIPATRISIEVTGISSDNLQDGEDQGRHDSLSSPNDQNKYEENAAFFGKQKAEEENADQEAEDNEAMPPEEDVDVTDNASRFPDGHSTHSDTNSNAQAERTHLILGHDVQSTQHGLVSGMIGVRCRSGLGLAHIYDGQKGNVVEEIDHDDVLVPHDDVPFNKKARKMKDGKDDATIRNKTKSTTHKTKSGSRSNPRKSRSGLEPPKHRKSKPSFDQHPNDQPRHALKQNLTQVPTTDLKTQQSWCVKPKHPSTSTQQQRKENDKPVAKRQMDLKLNQLLHRVERESQLLQDENLQRLSAQDTIQGDGSGKHMIFNHDSQSHIGDNHHPDNCIDFPGAKIQLQNNEEVWDKFSLVSLEKNATVKKESSVDNSGFAKYKDAKNKEKSTESCSSNTGTDIHSFAKTRKPDDNKIQKQESSSEALKGYITALEPNHSRYFTASKKYDTLLGVNKGSKIDPAALEVKKSISFKFPGKADTLAHFQPGSFSQTQRETVVSHMLGDNQRNASISYFDKIEENDRNTQRLVNVEEVSSDIDMSDSDVSNESRVGCVQEETHRSTVDESPWVVSKLTEPLYAKLDAERKRRNTEPKIMKLNNQKITLERGKERENEVDFNRAKRALENYEYVKEKALKMEVNEGKTSCKLSQGDVEDDGTFQEGLCPQENQTKASQGLENKNHLKEHQFALKEHCPLDPASKTFFQKQKLSRVQKMSINDDEKFSFHKASIPAPSHIPAGNEDKKLKSWDLSQAKKGTGDGEVKSKFYETPKSETCGTSANKDCVKFKSRNQRQRQGTNKTRKLTTSSSRAQKPQKPALQSQFKRPKSGKAAQSKPRKYQKTHKTEAIPKVFTETLKSSIRRYDASNYNKNKTSIEKEFEQQEKECPALSIKDSSYSADQNRNSDDNTKSKKPMQYEQQGHQKQHQQGPETLNKTTNKERVALIFKTTNGISKVNGLVEVENMASDKASANKCSIISQDHETRRSIVLKSSFQGALRTSSKTDNTGVKDVTVDELMEKYRAFIRQVRDHSSA